MTRSTLIALLLLSLPALAAPPPAPLPEALTPTEVKTCLWFDADPTFEATIRQFRGSTLWGVTVKKNAHKTAYRYLVRRIKLGHPNIYTGELSLAEGVRMRIEVQAYLDQLGIVDSASGGQTLYLLHCGKHRCDFYDGGSSERLARKFLRLGMIKLLRKHGFEDNPGGPEPPSKR